MRTDRTFVCTDCRVRSWPVRRCPACGETNALVDLERSPDAIAKDPRRTSGRADAAATVSGLGVLGTVGSLTAVLSGSLGLGEVGLVFSLPLLLGGVAMWPRGKQRVVPGDLRYRVLDSPVVRARAERARHEGEVRARATLKAPLSGRECVAWRLWAEGAHGALDDAMAVPFTIVIGAGAPDVEVDARIASIDLAPPDAEPAPLPAPDAELSAWLRARGVEHGDGLLVQEAVLVAGDPVEVTGTARRESSGDGYRGTRTREVLADLPGSPLIVRTLPSGRVGRSVSNA